MKTKENKKKITKTYEKKRCCQDKTGIYFNDLVVLSISR